MRFRQLFLNVLDKLQDHKAKQVCPGLSKLLAIMMLVTSGVTIFTILILLVLSNSFGVLNQQGLQVAGPLFILVVGLSALCMTLQFLIFLKLKPRR